MKRTDLVTLVYQKKLAELERAVRSGVDINAPDEYGSTLLMHAVLAVEPDVAVVKCLLSLGADPRIHDPERYTALHFAARDQLAEIVELLIAAGAVVDAVDIHGATPLWRCVTDPRTRPDIITMLIRSGADPDKKNVKGRSPRDMVKLIAGMSAILPLFDSALN